MSRPLGPVARTTTTPRNCIHWHNEAQNEGWRNYSFPPDLSGEQSPVIGVALDGYPIYGAYGLDSSGVVAEMKSSYRLRKVKQDTTGLTITNTWRGWATWMSATGISAPPGLPGGHIPLSLNYEERGWGDGFPILPNLLSRSCARKRL